jgi:hypothetical protein
MRVYEVYGLRALRLQINQLFNQVIDVHFYLLLGVAIKEIRIREANQFQKVYAIPREKRVFKDQIRRRGPKTTATITRTTNKIR